MSAIPTRSVLQHRVPMGLSIALEIKQLVSFRITLQWRFRSLSVTLRRGEWLFGSGQDPVTRNNIDPHECNWVHNNSACDGNPRVEDTASLPSYPGFIPLK